jgi:K+-transporting ATPase ATPase C chain
MDMIRELKPALILLLIFTLLTGLIYPMAVTAIAQTVLSFRANGSFIERDGKAVGSQLIGQPFSSPKYFWPRPSATAPYPYNAAASSGSNQGPLNPALADAVAARIKALREADPNNTAPVPVDLVTASGSGLDPHISLAAAVYQAARVAAVRKLEPAAVQALIDEHTQGRQLGILGEPRVNVLELNLALDEMRH